MLNPVFILGCPRSGSTWTSQLLTQHPEVAAAHHTKFFLYLQGMIKWYRLKGIGSFVDYGVTEPGDSSCQTIRLGNVINEESFYSMLRHMAAEFYGQVAADRPGITTVVDKTPENTECIDTLMKILPDARFVHVVRNPLDAYRSMKRASRSWARWVFPTRPVDGARVWLEACESAEAAQRFPDRHIQVRYEDLVNNGEEELARIFRWAGLDVQEGFVDRALKACSKKATEKIKYLPSGFVSREAGRDKDAGITKWEIRVIENLAGKEMTRLGYPLSFKQGPATGLAIRMYDWVDAGLEGVNRWSNRLSQLAHWRWRGRKLEWNDP